MQPSSSRRSFLRSAGLTSIGMIGAGLISRSQAWGAEPASALPVPATKLPAASVPFGTAKLEVVMLEENLHVLMGAGGNMAVLTGGESAILVDAGLTPRIKDTTAAVNLLLAGAKKKTLINTHWHFDHTGGNSAFGEAGWTIVAHDNTLTRLTQTIELADLGMKSEPSPAIALPVVTFADTATLHAGSAVKLTKVAPAHTDTDIIAWFEKSGVLHTGDIFFNAAFPVIDRSTGGSLDGLMAATDKLIAMVDDKTRIIPGHGPMGTKADLVATKALLATIHTRLAVFGQKGATIEEVLAAKPLADLDDQWGRGFLRSEIMTKMAYGQWLKK